MSKDGLELVADLVAANVSSLAHTTDRLIENHKHDARELAEALLTLDDAIANCQVVDRRLLTAQASVEHAISLAERLLEEHS